MPEDLFVFDRQEPGCAFYKPTTLMKITEFSVALVELAKSKGGWVASHFNNVKLLAHPTTEPLYITGYYRGFMEGLSTAIVIM